MRRFYSFSLACAERKQTCSKVRQQLLLRGGSALLNQTNAGFVRLLLPASLASSFFVSRRSSTAQAVLCRTLRTTPPRAACSPRLPRKSRRVAMSSSRAAPALLSGDAYSRASAASQTYLSRVSLGKHLARVLEAMLDVNVCPCITPSQQCRVVSSWW